MFHLFGLTIMSKTEEEAHLQFCIQVGFNLGHQAGKEQENRKCWRQGYLIMKDIITPDIILEDCQAALYKRG